MSISHFSLWLKKIIFISHFSFLDENIKISKKKIAHLGGQNNFNIFFRRADLIFSLLVRVLINILVTILIYIYVGLKFGIILKNSNYFLKIIIPHAKLLFCTIQFLKIKFQLCCWRCVLVSNRMCDFF